MGHAKCAAESNNDKSLPSTRKPVRVMVVFPECGVASFAMIVFCAQPNTGTQL